jgi:alanine racemase
VGESVPMRAELVIDLAAIRHNVRLLKELAGTAMMTVVKADGYGHGLLEVAGAAREAGADWLGVATLDEALALRAGGDTGPVLCWLTVPGEAYGEALRAGVDVSLYSVAELEEALSSGESGRVQLKVDTGLSRGGAPRSGWRALFEAAAAQDRLEVTGIWSHFSSSDEPDDPANDAQEKLFEEALDLARECGLEPRWRHLANSAATILRPSSRYDLVRCGIASYGLDPAPGVSPHIGLRPAMTARAELAMTKRVEAGAAVSYGRTWTAEHPTTLGLVPAGYADGLPRAGSDRAHVWVDGAARPVRGRICMDQLVVDLGEDDPGAGAEVTIFGPHGVTAQDWAEACGTISYEIVTRVGGRFARRHVDTEGTTQ